MRLIKVFLVVLIVLGALFALAWQFVLRDAVAEAEIATAYTAKNYCSCRFVGNRPADICRDSFIEDVSSVSFHEGGEPGAETIDATVMWGLVSSTARHRPGFGCALVAD